MMNRRQFLLAASGGLLYACSNSGSSKPKPTGTPGTLAAPTGGVTGAASTRGDTILVVLELNGGNDALNTVVPLVGKYHDIRPQIGVADDALVKLPATTAYGLHPELAPLQGLIDAGRMTTLTGVGWESPTRSHFAALDMWWQASPTAKVATGWLGRGLDAIGATSLTDSSGVSLGPSGSSLAATKTRTTAVNDPKRFRLEPPKGSDSASIARAWASMSPDHAGALAAISLFAESKDSDPDEDAVSDTTGGKTITAQLISAARLIASDPTVRTIYISARGFDTHANQVKRHDELMRDMAVGIRTFFERIELAGLTDRVMLMTASEFGRRTYENASGGTDHGKAGALFIVGPTSTGKMFGEWNLADLDDGDLKPQIDPRSLYAVGLDWLGAPADEILGGTFPRYL